MADTVAKVASERSESKCAKQPNPDERTFESTLQPSVRILNQYCSLECPKSFCNTIGTLGPLAPLFRVGNSGHRVSGSPRRYLAVVSRERAVSGPSFSQCTLYDLVPDTASLRIVKTRGRDHAFCIESICGDHLHYRVGLARLRLKAINDTMSTARELFRLDGNHRCGCPPVASQSLRMTRTAAFSAALIFGGLLRRFEVVSTT